MHFSGITPVASNHAVLQAITVLFSSRKQRNSAARGNLSNKEHLNNNGQGS